MIAAMEQDKDGNWVIRVPLIGPTKERLEGLAAAIGRVTPVGLAASLLHDILEDDEAAHVSPDAVPGSMRQVH